MGVAVALELQIESRVRLLCDGRRSNGATGQSCSIAHGAFARGVGRVVSSKARPRAATQLLQEAGSHCEWPRLGVAVMVNRIPRFW
jgi:hypothetical protein